MATLGKWLLHEDRKELFDYLFAIVLNAVFLALVALVLWPLGRLGFAWQLAQGYWAFWAVLIIMSALLVTVRRILRVDLDSHGNVYVISALVVSAVLVAGWSAFAALAASSAAADAWLGAGAALYAIGFVSAWVGYVAVSAFYMGSIYRYFNIWVAFGSFVLFAVWPAAADFIFGWAFDVIRQFAA